MVWVPDKPDGPARVGYAIGKRVGGAVVRNRLRRRLRAILSQLPVPGGAYLISVRPEAVHLTTSDLEEHLTSVLRMLLSHEQAAK